MCGAVHFEKRDIVEYLERRTNICNVLTLKRVSAQVRSGRCCAQGWRTYQTGHSLGPRRARHDQRLSEDERRSRYSQRRSPAETHQTNGFRCTRRWHHRRVAPLDVDPFNKDALLVRAFARAATRRSRSYLRYRVMFPAHRLISAVRSRTRPGPYAKPLLGWSLTRNW